MYWTDFWQPTAHVQQNIFVKTLIEVCSPHLYASFGTFYAIIGQLLEAHVLTKRIFKTEKIILVVNKRLKSIKLQEFCCPIVQIYKTSLFRLFCSGGWQNLLGKFELVGQFWIYFDWIQALNYFWMLIHVFLKAPKAYKNIFFDDF